ncbi:hypothetical protein DdX_09879 [Ditylenchus destructor]|uniref:Uncharacterized protein n=1 Tax=Ditylenchus destructor TaxID=166010 RepID=A0AAD4R613_9BILA|nr:hypothetical protein DdX_09879 [Ditylenchus destructor]
MDDRAMKMESIIVLGSGRVSAHRICTYLGASRVSGLLDSRFTNKASITVQGQKPWGPSRKSDLSRCGVAVVVINMAINKGRPQERGELLYIIVRERSRYYSLVGRASSPPLHCHLWQIIVSKGAPLTTRRKTL